MVKAMLKNPWWWLLFIVIFIASSVSINYSLRRWVILPGFIRLELEQADSEWHRVLDAIERETEHLTQLTTDWAQWDDSYRFIEDKNSDYITSNLTLASLQEASGINMVFFYDQQGRFVWGEVFDTAQGGTLDIAEFPRASPPSHRFLLEHTSPSSGYAGIVDSEAGALLIAAQPILTSQGEGPIAGTLVIGRFLNQSSLDQLALQTQVDFIARPVSLINRDSDRKTSEFSELHAGGARMYIIDDRALEVDGVLTGIDGQPALAIRLTIPRYVMAEGIKMAQLAVVSIQVSLFLICLIGYLIFYFYTKATRDANVKIQQLVGLRTRQLRQAKEQAEEASLQAEAANAAKTVFLANMSHEIRTPMNAMINLSYLCLQGALPVKQRKYIEKLHHAAQSLLRIINDVLDFSKIEAGKMTLELADFSLDDLLAQLAVLENLRRKDVQLLFDVAPGTPLWLEGDMFRINQLLVNLLGNAFKFTDTGEVRLSIRQLKQHSGSENDPLRLEFLVEDSGIGISQKVVDKMFEAFTQADSSTTRRFGGSGLGLVICRQLAELMGGRLSLTSELAVGTRVRVVLPLALAGKVTPSGHDPATAGRVLLLGEQPSTLLAFEHSLTAFGLAVSHTSLTELADTHLAEVDVLLIDESCNRDDLLELCRKIRADGLPGPLALYASASDELPVQLAGYDLRHVKKPLYFSRYCEAVRPAAEDALDQPAASGELAVLAASLHKQLGQQRILLADDSELNQMIVVELLADCGAEVVLADNGQQVLERLQQQPIDVILMDIQMPVMDGMEATRLIRAQSQWQQIPIIALTASASLSDRQAGLSLGMNEYLTKPIVPAELYAALSRCCVRKIGPDDAAETSNMNAAGATRQGSTSSPLSTAEPTAGQDAAHYDGLDICAGLKTCNGKQALFNKLLRKFLATYSTIDTEISQAIAAEDLAKARRLAHKLTGVCANIGALTLADTAGQIDRSLAGTAAAQALAPEFCAPLQRDLQQLLKSVERYSRDH